MKVLFVSSGNNKFGISPIVYNQGESLRKFGVAVDYFTIKGKGSLGYLKNVLKLRKQFVKTNYNLIHAHYSLSALVATAAFPKIPLIVSLMGSDTKMNLFWLVLIKVCYLFFWKVTIVKSQSMKESLNLEKALVIPNGVDLEKFDFRNKVASKKILGLDVNDKHILFLANPERPEKNFFLAQKAIELLQNKRVKLIPLYDKKHDKVVDYLYATDILLLTSLWEGSPNAVKEAMACNVPIVSTDVGDVKEIISNTEGCFITSFDPQDVAQKLKLALEFAEKKGRTNGRQRIIELGLDSESVAKKIINVYSKILYKK